MTNEVRPYVLHVEIGHYLYRFTKDVEDTVDEVGQSLEQGNGHAPLLVYTTNDRENERFNVFCVTVTDDIKSIEEQVRRKHSIPIENIRSQQVGMSDWGGLILKWERERRY